MFIVIIALHGSKMGYPGSKGAEEIPRAICSPEVEEKPLTSNSPGRPGPASQSACKAV